MFKKNASNSAGSQNQRNQEVKNKYKSFQQRANFWKRLLFELKFSFSLKHFIKICVCNCNLFSHNLFDGQIFHFLSSSQHCWIHSECNQLRHVFSAEKSCIIGVYSEGKCEWWNTENSLEVKLNQVFVLRCW